MDMAIVVLGASQYDGRPSRVLTARLNEALATAKKHPGADIHFVTLGANMPGDRFTEAGVARTYLLDHGVDSHQVHAVPQGNDTQGSLEAALKTRQELVDAPSTIITDPLHTLRVKLIARQLGWKAQVKGARDCPYSFPQREWWGGMLHEAGGLVIVVLQGIFGKAFAQKIRWQLYKVEGLIRPRFKTRHGLLQNNPTSRNNGLE